MCPQRWRWTRARSCWGWCERRGVAGARSPAEKSASPIQTLRSSWARPYPPRLSRMPREGASAIAATTSARGGSVPPVPSARPCGVAWNAALCTLLPPPAVSGGSPSVPRRRPSLAGCPMARARIHGRPSSRWCGPPAVSIVPCPSGGRPRMAMRQRQPSIHHSCRRSPNSSRSMGCNRGPISTWRTRPS